MRAGQSRFASSAFKGFLIGAAGILPGASGGVLAVAMGVYRPALEALARLTRPSTFKAGFCYLFPFGVGGVLGLFLTSLGLEALMKGWRLPLLYLFLGMVLGGLPALLREANQEGYRKSYWVATAAGCALIAAVTLLGRHVAGAAALPFNPWTAALAGAVIGMGCFIPGLSTSFLLILFGLYEPMLSAFTAFRFGILLFAGLGALAGAALTVVFLRRMFARHSGYTYYAALGILLGSALLLLPDMLPTMRQLWVVLLLPLGFLLTWFGDRLGEPAASTASNSTEQGEKHD